MKNENDKQAAQPALPAEPLEYQYRTKPDWDERHPWTDWTRCTEGQYEDYKRAPNVNNWLYETRALCLCNSTRVQQLEHVLRDFVKYAEDCNDDSRELDRARAILATPGAAQTTDTFRLDWLQQQCFDVLYPGASYALWQARGGQMSEIGRDGNLSFREAIDRATHPTDKGQTNE